MSERRDRFPIVATTFCLVASLVFLVTPSAAARDCNGNGSEDKLDIEGGSSADCDSNGVPDECDLGPGNLLFSEPVDLALDGHSYILHVTVLDDFTADGFPDLVSFEPENLLFLRGSGQGTFLPPASIAVGPHVGIAALASDTNGDGLRDVVAAVRPLLAGESGLMVLEGKGDGSFEEPILRFRGGDKPRAIAAADLDGDGAVDIAATNRGLSGAAVWWNDGTGVFTPSAPLELALSNEATSVAAGDMDGDGDPDILATHLRTGQISLLWNEGGRSFSEPERMGGGDVVDLVVLGDLDRDGNLDLASSSEGHDAIYVVLNRGGRVFSDLVTYRLGGISRRVLPADADGDGSLDLVSLRFTTDCDRTRSSLSVLLNRGDGSFIDQKDWEIPLDPYSLALGDIDADGFLDAIMPRLTTGDQPRIVVSALLGRRGPSAADVDADGVPDHCALEGRDCNWNGSPDARDIALGTSRDCGADGVPDECEPDCDGNGIPDACDIAGGAADANSNGLLDACESKERADCNGNARLDPLDIASGASRDCDSNGVPDECEVNPVFRFLASPVLKIGLDGPAGGVAAADLDLDGDLDLAVARRGICCTPVVRAGSVALFENLGEERLVPAGSHAADGDPVLVAAVDADGDGDPDILVGNAWLRCKGPARGALLVNDGRGGFRRGEGFVLISDPTGVAAADLDRDGDLDLAFANGDPTTPAASIFLNGAQGAFTFAGGAGPAGGAAAIAAGDWNGDGLTDLSAASGALHVLVNAGGAAFTPAWSSSGSDGIVSVTPADLDRDGDLDLVAGHVFGFSLAPSITLLRNDLGIFSAHENHVIGTHPRSLVAGDWDGDGSPDVIAAGASFSLLTSGIPGAVSVLLNSGAGTLREAGFFTVDSAPPAAAAGDLNGDGTLDLLLADEIFGAAVVVLNEGGGRLAAPLQYAVGAGPRVVLALDANGDGDQDLAVLNELDVPAVTLLGNEGRGAGFLPAMFREGVPRTPRAMAAGDLDGDGDLDLAIAGEFKVSILLNDGGAFAGAAGLPVGSNPFAVVVSDLDRDGDADLATSNVLGSGFRDNVTVFTNGGSGAFAPGRNFAVGMAPVSLAASDLDGDGLDDLIACSAGSASLSLLRNLAGGGFAAAVEIPTWPAVSLVRSGDIDGDGDRDILASSQDNLLLHANLGSGDFLRGFPVGASFHFAFEPADLDGDTDQDLVLSTLGQVHVMGNRGNGSFGATTVFEIGGMIDTPLPPETGQGGSGDPDPPGASSIATSDLDGDGDLDLALAFFGHGKVLILSNATERAQPDVNQNSVPDACEIPSDAVFRRGDAKEDGTVDMTDAVIVLSHLFVTGAPLTCRKAADSNDDARVDVSDAVAILRFLFLGDDAPPEPFPGCGEDPTSDLLECAGYSACP